MLVIGVDLGGTGGRAALAENGAVIATARRDGITDRVTAAAELVHELLAARPAGGRGDAESGGRGDAESGGRGDAESGRDTGVRVDAVAVGSTGFLLRGQELRDRLPAIMLGTHRARQLVLCSDMVTGYVGALGLAPGVVIAAGTGAVALGSDMRGTWRRIDGWGYLLGDAGSGSWIGQRALQAALRHADGRPGGSAVLLAALRDRFGDPAELVQELARREDRAGVMAGFVRMVEQADCAVARDILDAAGRHLAATATAAIIGARVIAPTGNLFQAGRVRDAFRANLATDIDVREPRGSSVDGAIVLAAAGLANAIPPGTPCERFTA